MNGFFQVFQNWWRGPKAREDLSTPHYKESLPRGGRKSSIVPQSNSSAHAFFLVWDWYENDAKTDRINLDAMESTRSVQKVPRGVIWRIEAFIEEDTRNIVYRTTMSQSPSKKAPWDLPQFFQLLSATLAYFPASHWWSEIFSLSKVILVLGKTRSRRAPNHGL